MLSLCVYLYSFFWLSPEEEEQSVRSGVVVDAVWSAV